MGAWLSKMIILEMAEEKIDIKITNELNDSNIINNVIIVTVYR